MERRKFIIGAGALATGSAAAVGTGAFSSVEADRNLTVEVDNDTEGFLGLEAADDTPYVEEDDHGRIEFDFSDSGFNPDSITQFDPLFTMTNNGSNTVQPFMDLEVESFDAGDTGVSAEDIEDSIIFYAKEVTLTGIGPTDREDFTGEDADPGRGGVTYNHSSGQEVEWGLEVDFTDETGAMIPELPEEVSIVVTIGAEE